MSRITEQEAKKRLDFFLTMETDEVLLYFAELPNARFGGDYVYIPGTRDDAILLVAHADTVWPHPPSRIDWIGNIARPIHSFKKQKARWGERGLGADDRAGVAMVDTFLESGHGILITDGEEVGCLGAISAVRDLHEDLEKYSFAVEIDRRGDREFVFYDVSTPEFESFIGDHFGADWVKGYGSFTDISVIGEGVGICAVNLAAGYMFQHTEQELLVLDAWMRTWNKLYDLVHMESIPRFELPLKEDLDRWWEYEYEDRDTPLTYEDYEDYEEDNEKGYQIVELAGGLVKLNAAGDIVEWL